MKEGRRCLRVGVVNLGGLADLEAVALDECSTKNGSCSMG